MSTKIADRESAEYSVPNTAPVSLENMPLVWIEASPLNPRTHFDQEALQELADSIRTHGLLEALVVRPLYRDNANDCRYIIIAGERRFRAAQMAGLLEVPVRILSGIDEKKHLELALIENLQRQDLDPLEEAAGYRSLREIGYTQTQIATAVHRSQPAIAKAVALLELPEEVQDLIRAGQLTVTHGVALGRFKPFPRVLTMVARIAAEEGMTTQQLEKGLPAEYELKSAGVVKEMGTYNVPFDLTICKTCPYGAHIDGDYGREYCLRPSHFDELVRQAAELQQQKVAATLEKVTKSGAKIPSMRELGYTTYEQIYESRGVPVGCSDRCPCRSVARDYDKKIVPICTDPKRYKGLQAAETRARHKAGRELYKERLGHLEEALTALTEVGPRELAIIVAAAFSATSPMMAREAAQAHMPALVGKGLTTWEFQRTQFTLLSELSMADQARLVLDALIRGQIHGAIEFAGSSVPWYDWLVGKGEPAEAMEGER